MSSETTMTMVMMILQRKRKREEEEEASEEGSRIYGHGKRWVRGGLLGKGNSGSVFLARSKRLFFPSRLMAVKTAEISVSLLLQRERQVLSNLFPCPQIRLCFGEEITRGINNSIVYNLLLDYGSGGSLSDHIKSRSLSGGGLQESEVRRFAKQIILGLKRIHDCGYVLRDLRPQNLILFPVAKSNPNQSISAAEEYMVKIGDCGSAMKVRMMKKRKLGTYLRGNINYLSPEAVVDGIQEPPSDIWALGCIVIEMLTGKPMWFGKTKDQIEDGLRNIYKKGGFPRIPLEVSKDGKDFLRVCLARRAENRLTAGMLLEHQFVAGLDDVSN